MKLVKFTHYAPKDSREGIQEYLLANDHQQVFDYLTSDKNSYTYWDSKITLEDYEDDWDEPEEAMATWIEMTLDEQGDLWNDDKFTDLYYGATGWHWEEMEDIDCEDYETMLMIETMIKNKLVIDLTKGDMK